MSNRVLPVLLCMTLASSAAVRAEESGSTAAISAAFSSENYDKGLELIREVFARLQPDQSAQATTLIKSILASVPKDQAGQIVVAAIQGNPSLGTPILKASVSGASRDEQLAILSRVNFALTQHPEQNSALAQHVPEMLTSAARTVPVSMALTAPTFNPANSPSDTKTINSPSDIKQDEKDIRQDKKDISQDQAQLANEHSKLRADIAQLIKDIRENKPPSVIRAEEAKINEEERDIKASDKDLKADKTNLKADDQDLRQDLHGH
jgi:hypothetical protein